MVAVIQKSMKILSVIADGMGAAVTLQRISELTGYPKPTCARILATLCEDGYAVRVSHSEGYRLGPSLYYLTRHGRYDEELVSLCAPVVRWLERKSHATVVLSVIQSGRKFIIDYADREQHLFEEKERIRIGDIYRTATGRAILAHMSEGEVREIYERYGNPEPGHWDRVRSYSDLVAALAELRCEKIVVSSAISAKRLHNARGYACPIFRGGLCIGAIGIAQEESAPEGISAARDRELRDLVWRGTKEIHRRIAYEDQSCSTPRDL